MELLTMKAELPKIKTGVERLYQAVLNSEDSAVIEAVRRIDDALELIEERLS